MKFLSDRRSGLKLVLLSSLLLSGCAGEDKRAAPNAGTYETPGSAVPEAKTAPYMVEEPQESRDVVRVFYGTNRQRNLRTSDVNEYYGREIGKLQFGHLDVSIPSGHSYGEVERPSLWRLEFSEDPEKHVVLQSIQPVDRDEFVNSLAGQVRESHDKEVFVFVHGFNVAFDEAARRTAQMSHDLKFDGPPVMFSWPSDGSLSSYIADMDDADASEPDFREFIQLVARKSHARRIHLVAHSMGNRLVTSALQRLAEESQFHEIPRLNEVILAAPDVDANVFKNQIAPRIHETADRVTIYASSTDRALQASKAVHQKRRLGLGGEGIVTFPKLKAIDVVDASGLDLGWFALGLGHSAYGNELLEDIKGVLHGTPAQQRHLQRHAVQTAWRVANGSTEVEIETPPVDVPRPWWKRIAGW